MKIDLINAMKEAVKVLGNYPSEKISLFHHNDTDGLCSGTILMNAFEQSGYTVSRYSLEKPYPQVLSKIFHQSGQIIVFTDFAGKIAPLISRLNEGRNLVLILDHHPAETTDDPTVFNLDVELFGLKGDRDISASATCYLFAEVLLEDSEALRQKSAHLGVLGAIGDGFLVDGALSGVNRELMEIAQEQRTLRIRTHERGEEYFITLAGVEYPASYICNALDTVGGVDYYYDGTTKGIQICQEGLDEEMQEYVRQLVEKKDEIFTREICDLQRHIRTTDHIQWFDVQRRFEPMGVKMIGVFCTMIKDLEFLDKTKYLAGFQQVPDLVPGFGEIEFNATKISMRVSQQLTDGIQSGKIAGLSSFLPEATTKIGGFVDACHGLSAATTVRIGQEQQLIDEIEKTIQERIDTHE